MSKQSKIDELERILNSEDDTPIDILPSGKIRPRGMAIDDPAMIQAELVDVRNVGFNKAVKLTLHVPAEYATKVLDAFGWPTAVDPVPVVVARLKD